MYEYITGRLTDLTPDEAIVECGGIGYRILISLSTYTRLNEAGSEAVKLYLHHQLKEDDENLFGFFDKRERALFLLLISVSSVGAATARAILSALSAEELTQAILSQDAGRIKQVKGIGLKTAQRLILELKDKIAGGAAGDFHFEGAPEGGSPVRQEACSALALLGFQKPVVEKIVDAVLREDPSCNLEELIKRSLKML